MNKELSTPQTWFTSQTVATWLRSAGVVLAGTALVAACAHVALPLWFTPVPLTLQPFAVLLLGLLLTPRLAGATLAAYLAEGALGLPVFAPGPDLVGGPAHLFGPTGGYLLAYPAAAIIISLLWRHSRRGFAAAIMSAAVGDLVILICGASWLASLTHLSAGKALSLAILPFLPGEALKVVAAAASVSGLRRLKRHRE
ncbi:MAG TPA: biotin transporter BioY [Terracidiphilus sp.]|nr:biotin transporter BioY [Terracidiphilus sp.]